jgi:hypothetical protein
LTLFLVINTAHRVHGYFLRLAIKTVITSCIFNVPLLYTPQQRIHKNVLRRTSLHFLPTFLLSFIIPFHSFRCRYCCCCCCYSVTVNVVSIVKLTQTEICM